MSGSLVETQRVSLARMEVKDIPRGATFPLKLIDRFLLQSGIIIDAGCGTGENIRLNNAGYSVIGLDINQAALIEAKSRGMVAFESDLTQVGFPDYFYSSLVFVELADAVLAEGLLSNFVEDQPDRFFKVAEFYLSPEGYLLIADILQPTEDAGFLKERLSPVEAHKWLTEWEKRYRANEALGLPYGTFVVAKPGPNKVQEWGSSEQLQALIASPDFERYARHYTREEIRASATAVGLEERHFDSTIFYSRTNEPLLGCLCAFQKGEGRNLSPIERFRKMIYINT